MYLGQYEIKTIFRYTGVRRNRHRRTQARGRRALGRDEGGHHEEHAVLWIPLHAEEQRLGRLQVLGL